MDGAGPQGSMVVPGFIARKYMDIDKDDKDEEIKFVEQNNLEASQTYRKDSGGTVLTFPYKERIGFTIRGERLNPDETWDYVKDLNFDGLNKIIE